MPRKDVRSTSNNGYGGAPARRPLAALRQQWERSLTGMPPPTTIAEAFFSSPRVHPPLANREPLHCWKSCEVIEAATLPQCGHPVPKKENGPQGISWGPFTWRFGRAGSGASDARFGPCASAGNSELGWAQLKLGWCDIRATPCCVHITQLFHQRRTGFVGGLRQIVGGSRDRRGRAPEADGLSVAASHITEFGN